jgi:hypothetical protein
MTTTDTTPTIEAAPTTTGTFTPARTLSILSLVLGGASIIFGQTFLLPLAAIVLGVIGYRQEFAGRTMAVWGIVLGALAMFGWMIALLVGAAVVAPWFVFAWAW